MELAHILDAVEKLPDELRITGTALSRAVYINDDIIDATYTKNYNWSCDISGTRVLALDLWVKAGIDPVVAAHLAPTLSKYILQYLPDNFDVTMRLKDFMKDVIAEETPNAELYAKYVDVHRAEVPNYVEITKDSAKNAAPSAKAKTRVVEAEEDENELVETEFGRERKVMSQEIVDALKELRETDK